MFSPNRGVRKTEVPTKGTTADRDVASCDRLTGGHSLTSTTPSPRRNPARPSRGRRTLAGAIHCWTRRVCGVRWPHGGRARFPSVPSRFSSLIARESVDDELTRWQAHWDRVVANGHIDLRAV